MYGSNTCEVGGSTGYYRQGEGRAQQESGDDAGRMDEAIIGSHVGL